MADRENKPTFTRRILPRLAAAAFGVVIGLFLLEIGLRVVGYSSPDFYETDPTLGYRLIPGMSGWYSREGRSFVTINSDGFRDDEHAIDKPTDVYRIAIIGDSYVEALQVDAKERFSNFVSGGDAHCDAIGDKRIEVLTFGVSGYGTAQELLMAREKVYRYSPDLVILVVTTNNDITDNARYFKQTPIPYFVTRDGELVLDDSFREDRVYLRRSSAISRLGSWLMNHLRFAQAYADIHRRVKYSLAEWRRSAPAAPPSGAAGDVGSEPGIDNQIYREPVDDNWRAAWDVTERLIAQMDKDAREHDARFAVVLASNGIQVVPDAASKAAFAEKVGVSDLMYPNRRLTQYCNLHQINSIDLVPELSAFAVTNGTYLHGFGADIGNGHWNQTGHKVAGEIIGRHLCEIVR